MSWAGDPENDRPMWIGGRALYGTTLLIIIQCVGMVVYSLTTAVNYGSVFSLFIFSSSDVLQGRVWQLLTYGLVNGPSIMFAVEMLMLWWFGKEVERYIGRKNYFTLYTVLILAPAILLTVLGLIGGSFSLAGSGMANFCVFIAFATLYPRAVLLFGILAKYMAYVLLAVQTLVFLVNHDWKMLVVMWFSAGVAYAGMKLMGVQGGVDWWETWQSKNRVQKEEREVQAQIAKEAEMNESIDPILEKIARKGMNSLTDAEKNKLERARSALLKKDKNKQ